MVLPLSAHALCEVIPNSDSVVYREETREYTIHYKDQNSARFDSLFTNLLNKDSLMRTHCHLKISFWPTSQSWVQVHFDDQLTADVFKAKIASMYND